MFSILGLVKMEPRKKKPKMLQKNKRFLNLRHPVDDYYVRLKRTDANVRDTVAPTGARSFFLFLWGRTHFSSASCSIAFIHPSNRPTVRPEAASFWGTAEPIRCIHVSVLVFIRSLVRFFGLRLMVVHLSLRYGYERHILNFCSCFVDRFPSFFFSSLFKTFNLKSSTTGRQWAITIMSCVFLFGLPRVSKTTCAFWQCPWG